MAQQRKRSNRQSSPQHTPRLRSRRPSHQSKPTPTPQETAQAAHKQRQNLQLRRALHDVFAAGKEQYALDTVDDILDGIVAHGMDMAEWAGTAHKSRKELEREVHIYKLEHYIRGYSENGRRVIRYGKGKWFHLPGKLYLQTRSPDLPDATIRRDEMTGYLGGVVKFLDRYRRGYVKRIDGVKATIRQVKDGAIFEQPVLLEEAQGEAE